MSIDNPKNKFKSILIRVINEWSRAFLKFVFDDGISLDIYPISNSREIDILAQRSATTRHVLKRRPWRLRRVGVFYSLKAFRENAFSIGLGDNLPVAIWIRNASKNSPEQTPPRPFRSAPVDAFISPTICPVLVTLFSPFHAVEFPPDFKS